VAARLYDAMTDAAGLCVHCDTLLMTATGRVGYAPNSAPGYRVVADVLGANLLPFCIDDASFLSVQ